MCAYGISHGFRLDTIHGPAQSDQAEWQILRRYTVQKKRKHKGVQMRGEI